MHTLESIQQLNRELSDQIVEEARRNPTAYPGKFVGIAKGQVVVVTDDLKELVRQLRVAEPDASKRWVVEPGLDTAEVHAIWEIG